MDYYTITVYSIITIIAFYFLCNQIYRKTDYGKNHKEGAWRVIFNKGNMGEYNTSRQFEKCNFYHKIIYNCYIPKNSNESTEIDLIAITKKGIWVIENKNYSGWIFGNEDSKNWCQMLNKKKFFFYNPVKQNKSHLKYLSKLLKDIPENYYKSIIVFNSADLKKISVKSENVYVFTRNQFRKFIKKESEEMLDNKEIDKIYNILLPYTKVTNEQKKEHIENIKSKYK